jgi:antitoxin Phd
VGTWQLQDAKAKLSELIDTAEKQGPQIITRRGVETVVVVPIEEWRRAQPKKTLLEVLQSGPRGELDIPPRGSWKMRKPVKF